MYRFRITLYGTSPAEPLAATFAAAAEALAALPRLCFEPDGSFVWTGSATGEVWQVDGNLIDRGDRLAYVELSGRCPPEQFDALLRAFDWPQTPLSFYLPQSGRTLDEAEIRRLAEDSAGELR
jgi:hypothetical protein